MNVHYHLTGSVEVPDGLHLSETETAIVLPDRSTIKLWEAWERHDPCSDDYITLSYDQMCALRLFGETASVTFEET